MIPHKALTLLGSKFKIHHLPSIYITLAIYAVRHYTKIATWWVMIGILLYCTSLSVCLFPIQIGTAVKYAVKRAMLAEGRPGHVLNGPACDYLPCGGRTCEVFLGQGTETPHLFDVMWSPVTVRNTLKRSKTAEGSLGRALRGPGCDYLPCGCKDSPTYFRPGGQNAILFFIWRHADPLGISGCTKLQRWTQEHLDGLAECFAQVVLVLSYSR